MEILKMQHAFVILLLSLMISCRQAEINSPPTLPSDIAEQIDSIGNAFFESGGVQGLAITVAQEGTVVYHNGFGHIDSAAKKPVTVETRFLMASISKLICAAMIMKLAEEEKLTLDQTLAELLPDFPDTSAAQKITLRHLLTHTAGLKDYATVIDTVFIETGVSPVKSDYYHFFAAHALDFEPGSDFSYSNSGFVLAAMIIEQVTGNSLRDELNRMINVPSGLDFQWIDDRITDDHLTALFEVRDSAIVQLPHWTWIKGDGGLTVTPHDLALFPFAWSDGTIISRTSFDEMCASTALDDGVHTRYGLGVRTGTFEGEYCVGHTGGNITTKAVLKYYPELQTSVVVMVNTDNSPADAQVVEGFVSLVVLRKPLPDPETLDSPDFEHAVYTGLYTSPPNMYYGTGDLSIVTYPGDHHLYWKPPGSDAQGQKLYYLGDHTFTYANYPMDRVIFEADSSGSIVAFNTHWNGLRKGRLWRKVR